MSAATCAPQQAQIGEAAGVVWRLLDEAGPMSLPALVKASGLPRDLAMQAVGWLAREEKLSFEEHGRRRLISLT
jgi:hypothetical protein